MIAKIMMREKRLETSLKNNKSKSIINATIIPLTMVIIFNFSIYISTCVTCKNIKNPAFINGISKYTLIVMSCAISKPPNSG